MNGENFEKIFEELSSLSSETDVPIEDITKYYSLKSLEKILMQKNVVADVVAKKEILDFLAENFHVVGDARPIRIEGNVFGEGRKEIMGKCHFIYFPSNSETSEIKKMLKGKYKDPDGLFFCTGREEFCYISGKGRPYSGSSKLKIPKNYFCSETDEFCPLNYVDYVFPLHEKELIDYLEDNLTKNWTEGAKNLIDKTFYKLDNELNEGIREVIKSFHPLPKDDLAYS